MSTSAPATESKSMCQWTRQSLRCFRKRALFSPSPTTEENDQESTVKRLKLCSMEAVTENFTRMKTPTLCDMHAYVQCLEKTTTLENLLSTIPRPIMGSFDLSVRLLLAKTRQADDLMNVLYDCFRRGGRVLPYELYATIVSYLHPFAFRAFGRFMADLIRARRKLRSNSSASAYLQCYMTLILRWFPAVREDAAQLLSA